MEEGVCRKEMLRTLGGQHVLMCAHAMLDHANANVRAAALWGLATITGRGDYGEVGGLRLLFFPFFFFLFLFFSFFLSLFSLLGKVNDKRQGNNGRTMRPYEKGGQGDIRGYGGIVRRGE